MRKILTFALALVISVATLQAQTVATFDTLSLTGTDTFYLNYSSWGNDVGFDDGLAHFPCIYDSTQWGKAWSSGFVYTNMTDVSDSTYNNPYTAITAKGYNNSSQYLSVYAYSPIKIHLKGKAMGQPVKGFYATNLLYSYNEMTTEGFTKKFGDSSLGGGDVSFPDWYKITIKGYQNGSLKTDSVDFYLADFRDSDNTKDYILHSWEWVDLLPLGEVDSLELSMSSSDTANGGMLTPAYFAMDNFETYETSSVAKVNTGHVAKVYPNPATDYLFVELNDKSINEISVLDMSGKLLQRVNVVNTITSINTRDLPAGIYIVQMKGDAGVASARFVKQ